jgi:hypothetical protein
LPRLFSQRNGFLSFIAVWQMGEVGNGIGIAGRKVVAIEDADFVSQFLGEPEFLSQSPQIYKAMGAGNAFSPRKNKALEKLLHSLVGVKAGLIEETSGQGQLGHL